MIMKSIVLATLVLLIAAVPAWAVAPTVRSIQPVGGQRGTEVTVTLTGQRLADIQEILFYQPGITVTKIVGGKYCAGGRHLQDRRRRTVGPA